MFFFLEKKSEILAGTGDFGNGGTCQRPVTFNADKRGEPREREENPVPVLQAHKNEG